MMEAGLVIGLNNEILYEHVPADRSVSFLPDSRSLWDVLWEHRDNLLGFAHSHPGSGDPSPSGTDLSTFDAVERGLSQRLKWWITSSDTLILCQWEEPQPDMTGYWVQPVDDTLWVARLRELSY